MSSNTVANRGCWVGNAFDYVLFHVPRKGLDDIASDLGVGPVETYRVSVLEEDLLIQTRESLSDIAERAGFADQAAFTRTFHQIVGMSPGRWRRDHQRRFEATTDKTGRIQQ